MLNSPQSFSCCAGSLDRSRNDSTESAVFRDNYRVRRLRLRSSSGENAMLEVADREGAQRIAIEPPVHAEWLQIIIDDLYPGGPEPDVAISELRVITDKSP